MSLLDYLPLLDGWKHRNITQPPLNLSQGQRLNLFAKDFEEGWVTSGHFYCTDPDLTFILTVVEKDFTKTLSVQPSLLNAMGLVNPNNSFPWTSVYNTVNNIYYVMYAPVRPWSFTGKVVCDVTLPSTAASAQAALTFTIYRVVIEDKAALIKSLRNLYSTLPEPEIRKVESRILNPL